MLKLIHALFLISVLIATSSSHGLAQQTSDREVDEIKNDVSRLYAGKTVKIAVHMKNGAKQKGYINDVGTDTFILAGTKFGQKFTIRYADVSKVNRSGLSQGQKTALIVGAVGAVVVAAIVFRKKKDEGGFRHPCLLCD